MTVFSINSGYNTVDDIEFAKRQLLHIGQDEVSAGEAVAQGEAGAVHLRPSRRVEHLGKGRLLLLLADVHVEVHPADHVARR